MNLAVACGAPVLVNSALFEVRPDGQQEWPPAALLAATAQIAAEHRQRTDAERRSWGRPAQRGEGGAAG